MNAVMGALRFDVFTLDRSRGVLLRDGAQIALRPQAFKVLAYLATRSGQVITNRELIENCWENPKQTHVNSVAQCIAGIREALGETKQVIIRTVPRQGYVFAAPVSAGPSQAAPSAGTAQDPPASAEVRDAPQPTISRRFDGVSWLPGVLPRWSRAVVGVVLLALVPAGGGWVLRNWFHAERPAELTMMAVGRAPSGGVRAPIMA